MREITIYVQDPSVLQHWGQLADAKFKITYDLKDLIAQDEVLHEPLLFLHYLDNEQNTDIQLLSQLGWQILAFSNVPSAEEGAGLFKLGIKGYLNAYAEHIRIEQALNVIESGNVWLGQMVMSAMIQTIPTPKQPNNHWKELLTEKELVTAEEILKGKSNKEIAAILNVTERTVKSYVHNLLEKFDVKDRLGLVLRIHNWQSQPNEKQA